MLGRTVGSYRIVDKLGEGGMGAVYSAEHELLRKRVAIKVLLPEYSRNGEIVQRFFNEARAAARLQHPGIVEVFDFGHDGDGAAYIVMEHLRGEPLSARLRRGHALAPAAVARIVGHVAGALGHAHREGIVHRDLKPDNIFLVPDPDVAGGERTKILDFGIAKLAGEGAAAGVKTRTGAVIGTPTYMAPEQCRGAAAVDHRADVYALGVIAYEMVTGRPPFLAEGLGELMAQHMFEAPLPPGRLVAGLPPAAEHVILRALAKQPGERFAEVGELAAALAQAFDAGGAAALATVVAPRTATSATPATTLGAAAAQVASTMPPARRRPWAIAAAAVAATAAVIAALAMRPSADRGGPAAAGDAAATPVAAAPATDAGPVDGPAPPPLDAAVAAVDAAIAPRRQRRAPPTSATHAAPPRLPPSPPSVPEAVAPTEAALALARAERAHASGDAAGAVRLATPLMRDPETRTGAYRVLVLAYCQLHNAEAARALYQGLAASRRDGLAARCSRWGVTLD